VSVPTLVACARHEPDNVFEQARELASLIPGSTLLPLDSCNHLLPERDPAWPRFLGAAEAFLAGDTAAGLTTVERGDAAGPVVQAKPRD
jgi:pimeloyl-ACP methyl ester carboxylesterase